MLRFLSFIIMSCFFFPGVGRASFQSCPARSFETDESFLFDTTASWEKNAQKFEQEVQILGQKLMERPYKGNLPEINLPSVQESVEGLADKGLISKSETQSFASKKAHPLYVFVSLSMKGPSIQSLLEQARTYGATVVIRGLKNNSFPETMRQFAHWIKKHKKGVVLHPKLFETYQVKEVPTIVLVGEGGAYDKIVGNVNLSYALDRFLKEGDAHMRAREILKEKAV